MLNNLVNRQIKSLKLNEPKRYLQFLDKVSDVALESFNKFGAIDIDSVPLKERIYSGCWYRHLLAADKITLDRWEAVMNHAYNVSFIKDDSINEPYIRNAFITMLKTCLDVKNNSSKSTTELLIKFCLYCIGDVKFKHLDKDITDEMLYKWYDNIKLGWIVSNPSGLFAILTNFNYYEIPFKDFYSINKYDFEELLIENHIETEAYESILAIRLEVMLFAPYALPQFNNATKQVKYI